MTAPRWKDILGRVWWETPLGGWYTSDHMNRGKAYPLTEIQDIVGPLEPVEERCRVRVTHGAMDGYACLELEGRISAYGTVSTLYASTWPRARAEEIAAACRVLGWEAVVEVVE